MRAKEVPWSKRGKVGAVRDSEPVTVTFVVADVLKLTLGVSHRNEPRVVRKPTLMALSDLYFLL